MAAYKLYKKYVHKEETLWVEDIEAENEAEAKKKAGQIYHQMERRGEWPWEIVPILISDDGTQWAIIESRWELITDQI